MAEKAQSRKYKLNYLLIQYLLVILANGLSYSLFFRFSLSVSGVSDDGAVIAAATSKTAV